MFILYISDGNITHKLENEKLSILISIIEKKKFDIENMHFQKDIVLSGSNNYYDFFFIIDDTKQYDIKNVYQEVESIYRILPIEKAQNKRYMLVEHYGSKFIIDYDYNIFSIKHQDPVNIKKDKDNIRIVAKELLFDEAVSIHLNNLNELSNRVKETGFYTEDADRRIVWNKYNPANKIDINLYNSLVSEYTEKGYAILVLKHFARLTPFLEYNLKKSNIKDFIDKYLKDKKILFGE